ncbi:MULTISPECIES: hypothetical protein [Streptomyces]|uniref:hypothetical protein n=1 Tax=Streptomyces TaxID=1883 RepID=UPI00025CC6A9|nr:MULTISPECIES: hypothetical protein [Streptomyces]EIF93779.1 resolvase domain-containing protein [Streptomyces tsukubensis NRRL18488]
MANLVYKRVSTDQQSTARQDLVLDEAGIEDPFVFEEDPGTSSRLHPSSARSSARSSATPGPGTPSTSRDARRRPHRWCGDLLFRPRPGGAFW